MSWMTRGHIREILGEGDRLNNEQIGKRLEEIGDSVAYNTLNRHLGVLTAIRILKREKEGRNYIYSLSRR